MRDGPFFKIPPAVPFIRAFARGLLTRIPKPEELARTTVFLPYQRAATELREVLREESTTQATLLPRIRCLDEIGNIANKDRNTSDVADSEVVIDPIERLGLLTNLICAIQRADAARRGVPPPPFLVAIRLSQSLIGLLDQSTIEGVSLERVRTLVGEEFARHWQITLDFLRVILDVWPQILAQRGMIEPYVAHRDSSDRLIKAWTACPPQEWIIFAGSTGTMPATARLIQAVSQLPKGAVILPGLWLETPEDLYEASEATHPQYNLARLLRNLDVNPQDVSCWQENASMPRRATLLKSVFGCEATVRETDSKALVIDARIAIEGLSLIPCRDMHEESLVIALLLRHALEAPGRRATLISPDPILARHVQENMKRWGIAVHNSSGILLDRSRIGVLMRLILDVCGDTTGSASPRLALLKHPSVGQDTSPAVKSAWIRAFERQALRGLRPRRGLDALEDLIPNNSKKAHTLRQGVCALQAALAPLMTRITENTTVAKWAYFHRSCLANLVSKNDSACTAEDRALKQLLGRLEGLGDSFGSVDFAAYVEVFCALLGQNTALSVEEDDIQSPFRLHPRLQILGTMEARLIQTDIMILGGLNESVWPASDDIDPWLSRPMRQEIGLPSLERRIGLMAHDFCQAFAGKDVFITRSTRVDGAPSVSSRFLLRLQTTLEARGITLHENMSWRHIAQNLETPERFEPELAPAPRPPVTARPQRLSVTQVELWRRDPYALYARHILGLRPLEPLDEAPSMGVLGSLVHSACERAFKSSKPVSFKGFLSIGEDLFAPYKELAGVQTFWWPRFCQIAKWLVANEQNRRAESGPYHTLTECWGRLEMPHSCGLFTITARADRIDVFHDGHVDIIDYKTGIIPTETSVRAGFSPQLPLEATMALAGKFPGLPVKVSLGTLSYWGLRGRDKNAIKTLKINPTDIANSALLELQALIELFNNPQTAYRSIPGSLMSCDDYVHLARILAWQKNAQE